MFSPISMNHVFYKRVRRHAAVDGVSSHHWENQIDQLDLPASLMQEQALIVRKTKITRICADTANQEEIDPVAPNSSHIEELYALHWDELCGYLRAKFKGTSLDSEDIAQAAFTKFAGLEHYEKINNPRGFLYAVARNFAFDEFRKEKVRLAHKEGVKHAHVQDLNDHLLPENVLLQRQTIKAMANSVKMLPKTERTVLLLHRLDKLTYTQIAKKTGFSETTIRRKVAKAVERIRKDLIRATGL